MYFAQFGDVKIFRPSPEVETYIRHGARDHLLSRFSPGVYRGAKAANEILHHQFGFYEKHLRQQVEKLPIRSTLDFLLSQYDASNRIVHGHDIIDSHERETWNWIEPRFRRAIKYLVELLCVESYGVRKVLRNPEPVNALEIAVTCAESMVALAHESDLLYSIFPDDCAVSVFNKGLLHCSISIEGPHGGYDHSFSDRVIRDRQSREQFVPQPQFDIDPDAHAEYLNTAFQSSFGMGYVEFIETIQYVIEGCSPVLNGPTSLFVHRDTVLNEIAKSGYPRNAIECAINGFSIAASKLIEEGRVVWNPKQENRAYRRGFYVFPHKSGQHLAFSRAMAQENLIQLVGGISYKYLPKEWQTPETKSAGDDLSRAAGVWFERLICKRLTALGIIGQPIRRHFGNHNGRLSIPGSVGDIDFLGYIAERKTLVCIEAKNVMTGLEARYWRDDLDEFVIRSGSYAEHFRKKLAWVKANVNEIAFILGYGPVRVVGGAMLTLYPCIAREFIPDFPCVSLTEFLLDYEQKSGWPYQID
jgi:hypothetical protein